MYSLLGIEKNVTNLYLTGLNAGLNEDVETLTDLRKPYLKFLGSVHPDFPIDYQSEIVIQDNKRARAFASAFSASLIDDLDQERMVGDTFDQSELKKSVALAKTSLAKIGEIDPKLKELLDVAVHSILLCGSERNSEGSRAHGGTTNKCIGLIWLNINDRVSTYNVIEMLIHELTHTLVFVDEVNYGHFNYKTLTKKEYWATSSILKRERPMDKVIHSILVALELLIARETYLKPFVEKDLLHPQSKDLKASTLLAIESVQSHRLVESVCEPRALELVTIAKTELLNL